MAITLSKSKPSYTDISKVPQIFAITHEVARPRLVLNGSADTIIINGKATDFLIKSNGKTIYLSDSQQLITITFNSANSNYPVTNTLQFSDGTFQLDTNGKLTTVQSLEPTAPPITLTGKYQTVIPIPSVAYTIQSDRTSVNEGDTVTFTLSANNLSSAVSLPYTISGVSASDIVGASLKGNIVLEPSHPSVTIPITIATDYLIAEQEILSLAIAEKVSKIPINDTSLPSSTPALTISLTNAADNGIGYIGTNQNDTFLAKVISDGASDNTLNLGDSLVGGLGDDSLSIDAPLSGNTSVTGFYLNSIENLDIHTTSSNASHRLTLDVGGQASFKTVNVNNSTADVSLVNLGKLLTLNTTDSSSDITLAYAPTLISGKSDNQQINLNGVSTYADSSITVNGVETFTVNSSAKASGDTSQAYEVTLSGDALKKLIIKGDQSTVLGIVLSTPNSETAVIDASSAQASLSATITAQANDKLSISGGAGNDDFIINALNGLVTVSGAQSSDKLEFASPPKTISLINNSIASILFSSGVGSSSLEGLASGANILTQANGLSLDVTINNAAINSSDSLSLSIGKAGVVGVGTNGVAAGTLTAHNVETINITSLAQDSATSTNTLTIAGNSVTKLTVTGAVPFTLTQTGQSLTTYDASSATAAQDTSKIVFNSGTATVYGGSAADTLSTGSEADSIVAGSGNDSIVSGAGNDTIDAGLGDDTINAGDGNDSVDAGTGNDTINTGLGDDTINAGDGNDSITGGLGSDSLTGGLGADTFVFADGDSTATTLDTITDFVSGTDHLSLGQTIDNFCGNFGNLSTALQSMTAANQAFFVTNEQKLYLVAIPGSLQTTDDIVYLPGVIALTANDLGTTDNRIILTAISAVVNASTNTNASRFTTNNNDVISSVTSYVTDASGLINGLDGNDTLLITGGSTVIKLDDFINIETLDLRNQTVATVQTYTTSTNQFQTLYLSNYGDTVALTGNTGISVLGGSGMDQISIADNSDKATIQSQAGNDIVSLGNYSGYTTALIETGPGIDTVILGNIASTNTLTLSDTLGNSDLLKIANAKNTNLTGSIITGFEILKLGDNATVTLSSEQYQAFTSVSAELNATSTVVNLTTSSTNLSAAASIATYKIPGSSKIKLSAAAQNLYETSLGSTTVDIGSLSWTGSYSNYDGIQDDTLIATNGADFSSQTTNPFKSLSLTGNITINATQYNSSFAKDVSASGSNDSYTLSNAGTFDGNYEPTQIETINLANGTNVITLAGTTSHTINGGSGADTINITSATDGKNFAVDFGMDSSIDKISINNSAIDPSQSNLITINHFNVANDQIKLALGGTALTTAGFQTISSANTAVTTGTAGILEITASTIADLSDDSDGGTIESLLVANLGSISTGNYTVIVYSTANAAIYEMNMTDSGSDNNLTATSEIKIEHLITLIGVSTDSLSLVNFYSS